MFKSIISLITVFQINALAGFNLESAKALAYQSPVILSSVIIESITYKCKKYLNYDEAFSEKNRFLPKCFFATKELVKILDLKPFEVEKETVLPISFSSKLLELSENKNVLILLDHFNKNIHEHKINELKKYVTMMFKDKFSFEELVAVLFQDTTLSHLKYLAGKINQDSLNIIEKSNKKFFEALTQENEMNEFYGYPVKSGNPYHFYVIRHLAKKLESSVGYEMAAYVAFLFNYSYELFELEDKKLSYLHRDPKQIKDGSTVEDIKLGFLGAYFKDDFSEKIPFIEHSIKNGMDHFIYENSKRLKQTRISQ